MPRSPFFLFAVIVVVAVSFVFVAGMMNSQQPVDAGGSLVYNNTSQPANHTAGMLTIVTQRAPVWVMPAVWLTMAILVISVLFLVARRR